MFKRFIVATDLSPASFAVVDCLAELTALGGKHCLLLQCLGYKDAASTALSYSTDRIDTMLDEQKTKLEEQGFLVEARSVIGSPKQEIVRIAADENYDLIVVGSQGASLVEEKLLGGVAYGVGHNTTKPTMVVPAEKGEENTCKPVARSGFGVHILFATDFSETADNAFSYVLKMAAAGIKKITLTHVQDKTRLEHDLKAPLEEFNKQDRKRFENLKQELLKKGDPEINIEICYGAPYQEITRLVREGDAQLVVMGTQGRGFVGEFFLGSVSHNVLRHSVAPVLLIPTPR